MTLLERSRSVDRAVRQIDDREAVFPVFSRRIPSADGEPVSVRRQSRRIDPAGVAAPIGRRTTRLSLPSGSDQSRTVLSSDAVASSRQSASTPMCLIGAVCMPVSMRRNGRWSGQALSHRRARRSPAVDRALVAAGVGQPLLERLDRVGAHLRRIEARGAAGRRPSRTESASAATVAALRRQKLFLPVMACPAAARMPLPINLARS